MCVPRGLSSLIHTPFRTFVLHRSLSVSLLFCSPFAPFPFLVFEFARPAPRTRHSSAGAARSHRCRLRAMCGGRRGNRNLPVLRRVSGAMSARHPSSAFTALLLQMCCCCLGVWWLGSPPLPSQGGGHGVRPPTPSTTSTSGDTRGPRQPWEFDAKCSVGGLFALCSSVRACFVWAGGVGGVVGRASRARARPRWRSTRLWRVGQEG